MTIIKCQQGAYCDKTAKTKTFLIFNSPFKNISIAAVYEYFVVINVMMTK